MDTIFIG